MQARVSMRPLAAPGLDPNALLGNWKIVATTLPFWRGKHDPTVEYAVRHDGTWSDTLTWKSAKGRTRSLSGVDRHHGEPGRFVWRGAGLLRVLSSEWAFVVVAPDLRWCVTWFSRASFGLTPEGMDVYARDRAEVDVASALALVKSRADLPKLEGWYETEA